MRPHADPFEPEGLEDLLARAERDARASLELDFLADVAAAAELEQARARRTPEPVRGARPGARPWWPAVAASVLFLVALAAWLARARGPGEGARVTTRPAPPYVASDLRVPEATDACFPAAMEPYARADWPAARAALEACLARQARHGPTRFYLAAACEQLGELARAAELYRAVSAASDRLLADHARLRLAELLVAQGDLAEARVELEALAGSAGELAPNARALLDQLRSR